MEDRFGRTINYLRLSITDRCNLRCRYCMPASGIPQKSCAEILRYEELLRIAAAAAALGICKVRVTGGEPLVRKGVIGFLQQLAQVPGIDEVALTTNGLLLAEQAAALRQAGVSRLNVSLDSLDPATFAAITRGGELEKVRAGLAAAEGAGLKIKLNMVVMRGVNDHEIVPFAALSLEKPWAVRFIEYMPTIREPQWRQQLVTGGEILARLQRAFALQSISSGRYCGPARPYRIAGARGTLGIITPMSDHFCGSCNRIRVTSTGHAKSCLLSGAGLDLKPYLQVASDLALQQALRQVIADKPAGHHLESELEHTDPFSMANIGG
jgi:cyclic pyranopterin phosphate synthase